MLLIISTGRRMGLMILAVTLFNWASAQKTTILPGNGAASSLVAPQGNVKYQRQFYLVDSTEVNKSGLNNGMVISSIGFTIGAAQDSAANGLFRVYLQNTADTVSRIDTAWTLIPSQAGNAYSLSALLSGTYEWQVRANCGTSSAFTPVSTFKINSDTCKSPTHFVTENITSNSATLRWIKPAYAIGSFKVEYSMSDSVNWITVISSDDFVNLTGLLPGKTYQWKVSSLCSADSSGQGAITFNTDLVNNCNPPSNLSVGALTDTSASVSWNGASGATRYEINYRRLGTSNWNNSVALSNNVTLLYLARGTTYEWRVRTVCGTNSYGAAISGPAFITTGSAICYPPENVYADSATDLAVKLTWDIVQGATTYQLRYRPKDIIYWSNAIAPMTPVHNDSLRIPDTTGAYDVSFVGGTPFTYTGKGLYIAYEYIDSNGRLSTENVSLANYETRTFKDSLGRDSANLYVSLAANSMDSLPDFLSATTYRPETRLGSATLGDSVEVAGVYTLGHYPLPFRNPDTVYAMIRNYTGSDKTYPVTLTVKDSNAVKHTETVTATVHADSVFLVTFSGWTPVGLATDSIIVSVPPEPNENVVNNNMNYYLQTVNNSILAYDDGNSAITSTGLDTATGLVLARYSINGCGAVNSAQIFLTSSAKGRPVFAVVTDASGSIVASSSSFIPDSSNTNNYHTFYFPSPVFVNNNTDFYVGLAQPDSGVGYLPVGVQWDGTIVRTGAFYRANLDGSGLTDHPAPGRLMIRAEIITDTIAPVINGNLIVCPSGNTTLTAGSITKRFANQVVDFSTQYGSNQFGATQALGTPNVYPQYTLSQNTWISSTADGQREYLVLGFPNPDSVNFVDIYETYNPGAVDTVYVKNPGTNLFDVVYSNTATNTIDSVAKINRISFPLTNYKVSEIRIAINSPADSGYNSIDAVAIGRMESNPSFSSYLWTKQTGSGPVTIGTGPSVTITDSGHYTLTVTNPRGCSASTSVDATTPGQIPPTISHSGPLVFCLGDSVILTSSKTGGNTWNTGATTNSIVVKTSGSYSVTHNDGSGCGTTTSASVTVTVNSLPAASISGQPGICPGGSTTLTAGPSGNTYLWSNSVTTITNVISSSGPISVLVTDANGCKASAQTNTFFVSKPAPHITGNLSFCPGGSTTINAGSGFASYAWSTTQTTPTITVNAPGDYYVTVTNSFGCLGADTVHVVQNTPPSPSITGGLSLCGGPTTLNAGGGYSAYLWSTSETSQTIIVNAEGNFSVTVTDFNGCTGAASVTTKKDSLPPTPGPINGSVSGICNTPGAVFSISPVPNTSHYVWFVPPGATIVSGQGDTAVVIAFDAGFTTGSLIVAASNACGQSGSLNPRVLPLKAIPANPTTINGATSGLCGLTSQAYSTPAIPGASSYTWTVPPGITITGGQGSSAITVNISNAFVSGAICVKANNSCGTSNEKCISVTGTPATPAPISGLAAVCFRQSNVIYSVPVLPGAVSYNWTVPEQASIASGQGTNSIRVNFGNKSGNIKVIATNACGSSAQQVLAVVVSNCVTTRSGNVNGSSSAEQRMEPEVIANDGGINVLGNMQMEWTLGEPSIESVTNKDRLYTQGFHQPVILMSKKTDGIIIQDDIKITAAPNPVEHTLTVSFRSDKDESLMVNLMDVNGKILFVKPINGKTGSLQIDMSVYSDGMYLLNVRRTTGLFSRNIKVIKVK